MCLFILLAKGQGGGKIFTPVEVQGPNGYGVSSDDLVPAIVLNRQSASAGNPTIKPASHLEMNMIWFVIIGLTSLFVLVFILFLAFMCNRPSQGGLSAAKKAAAANATSTLVYERNMRLLKKTGASLSPDDMTAAVNELDQQEQQLLQQTKNAELIIQSQMINCSNSSSNSTLLKVNSIHFEFLS